MLYCTFGIVEIVQANHLCASFASSLSHVLAIEATLLLLKKVAIKDSRKIIRSGIVDHAHLLNDI